MAELLEIRGEPVMHHVTRHHRMPQYHVGHQDRVARINSRQKIPTVWQAARVPVLAFQPASVADKLPPSGLCRDSTKTSSQMLLKPRLWHDLVSSLSNMAKHSTRDFNRMSSIRSSMCAVRRDVLRTARRCEDSIPLHTGIVLLSGKRRIARYRYADCCGVHQFWLRKKSSGSLLGRAGQIEYISRRLAMIATLDR